MAYLKSSEIKMFPSALRGTDLTESTSENNNSTTLINPEARLNSETNLTNIANGITISGSYVISYTNNILKFCIHGYYFEISNVSSYLSSTWYNHKVYANIYINNLSSSNTYDLNSLSSFDGSTNLDKVDNGTNIFTGLYISLDSSYSSSKTSYYLQLFDESGKVPKESLLKVETKNVAIENSTTPISEVIYKTGDQIVLDADEFVGHLTGNVTGNVTGNADTSTNSQYAAKLGTTDNHPSIGSNVNPVYVDNSGNIVKSNGNVGSKNVSMYLNSGVLTRGMTFYTSTSAPSSSDKAEDGDIWIQYV